ncbi:MAG: ester cyclase [Anaerolineae bacterium]
MSLEENKELVRQLLEDDISQGNEVVAERIIAADFFDHTNPPGMQHGLEGHKAIVRLFRAAFPDQWWHIEDLIAEGDKVVARTTMRGTHTGDFFGIPPTGRRVELPGVHIMRIANGRIAEHWGSNDDLGMMRQLGVIPSPEQAAG